MWDHLDIYYGVSWRYLSSLVWSCYDVSQNDIQWHNIRGLCWPLLSVTSFTCFVPISFIIIVCWQSHLCLCPRCLGLNSVHLMTNTHEQVVCGTVYSVDILRNHLHAFTWILDDYELECACCCFWSLLPVRSCWLAIRDVWGHWGCIDMKSETTSQCSVFTSAFCTVCIACMCKLNVYDTLNTWHYCTHILDWPLFTAVFFPQICREFVCFSCVLCSHSSFLYIHVFEFFTNAYSSVYHHLRCVHVSTVLLYKMFCEHFLATWHTWVSSSHWAFFKSLICTIKQWLNLICLYIVYTEWSIYLLFR